MSIKIEINPLMCRLCFKDSVPLHCSIETCQELVQNIAQIQVSILLVFFGLVSNFPYIIFPVATE